MDKRVLILLYLSLSSLFAFTPQPFLDLNSSHFHIGRSMSVYEDTQATLTFEQVSKLPSHTFTPVKKDVFSYPFTSSAFWYTFKVDNMQDTDLSRLMVFEAAWLDYIQINIVSPNKQVRQYEVGNTFEFTNRTIDHHLINQSHDFQPGISDVFIQVKTRDPFVFTLSILKEKTFLLEQIKQSKYIGLLYGILLAMLFYNLFLYFGIKEPYHAYYVLFVTAFLIGNASYNGYTFKLFFSHSPQLQNWMQSSSIFLFSLCNLLFAQSFLNLKQTHRRLNVSSTAIFYLLLFTALLSALIGGYTYHVIFSIVLSAIISAYILAIGFYSYSKGNRSALFFLLGSISGLTGTVITALTVMGQIPYYNLTYKALDVGMVMDALLLSLALAHKVRITQEEKLIAEKDSRTDVLTGLMNRRAYHDIGKKELTRCQRYKTDLSFVIFDIDRFKSFNDTYGHDVGDKVLIHFGSILENIKRENDYAFRLGGDEFVLLLPEANEEQALHLAMRIKEELQRRKLNINETELRLTASAGISQFQETDTSISLVEKRADLALYRAKGSEKGKSGSSSKLV